jgi:methane monooxygenase PmoA-like
MLPRAALCLCALLLPAVAQVHLTADDADPPRRILVEINGAPFTTFFAGADANKPYFAPLRSASGKIVTRRFPMEQVEGETRDHLHHRGMWFGQNDVNGVKFWENDPSNKRGEIGRIVVRKAEFENSVLTASFNWLDPQGAVLLVEDRTTTFYASSDKRMIDVDLLLTAKTKVVFGDDKDAGFAIRMADALNEKHTGRIVNAEGLATMKNVWGQPSAWADYSGELDGEKLGVAIFDHPSNPGYPNRWHARDYGLFAINPFGAHTFDPKLPTKTTTLERGQTLRYRWRLVIHQGDAKSAKIAELYREFAGR